MHRIVLEEHLGYPASDSLSSCVFALGSIDPAPRMPNKPADTQEDFPFRKFLRGRADGPTVKLRQTVLLALIGFSVTLGLVLAAYSLRDVNWRAWTGRQAPQMIPALPEPARKSGDASSSLPSSVLSQQALGRISGLSKPVLVEPPFDYIDASSFRSNTTIVLLAGIDAPKRSAVCQGADKTLWPCGIMARVALFNVIRHKPVLCELDPVSDPAAQPANTIFGSCMVENRNVAVELVRSGFARAAGLPGRDMQQAEEEARAAMRGLWNGNWQIMQLQ